MRKITEQAVKAFLNGEAFKSSNTEVISQGDIVDREVFLKLHGNLIAKRSHEGLAFTLAGWNTPTTKERINGLLELLGEPKVYTKQGQAYFGDHAIEDDEWVYI